MKYLKNITAISLVLSLLSGCTMGQKFVQTVKTIDGVQNIVENKINNILQNSTDGSVTTNLRSKIAGEVFVIKKNTLPPIMYKNFEYKSHQSETIEEMLAAVSEMIKINIKVSDILDDKGTQNSSSDKNSFKQKTISINYTGNTKGFFDEISAKNEISWRYNAKSSSIEFYRNETKTISLALPPGKKNVAASINLNGGGSGASSSGNVSVSQSVEIDPWISIMGGVRSVLSTNSNQDSATSAAKTGLIINEKNGYVIANPELGLITITARPNIVEKVTNYIDSVNKKFAQNIMIDVRVYNVTTNSNVNAGVNFNLLKEALGKFNLSVISSDLIAPESGIPSKLTLNSQMAGGSGLVTTVVQALEQAGKVSLVTQGQVIAINGQPSPFQQAREINYVSSSSSTAVANAGVTTSVQSASKIVGFTANFLPLILGDNRILLQYQIQSSSLLAMRQFTSGTSVTQLPEISTQSLQQQAFLKDGQALMLFGFDQDRQTDSDANGITAISKSSTGEHVINVVLIQVNTGLKYD